MTRNHILGWLLAAVGVLVGAWQALEYKRAREAVVETADEGSLSPYDAGTRALEAGDWGRAMGLLKLAVLQDPHAAESWNNLGRTFMVLDSLPQALEAFQRALQEDPNNQWAGSNMGTVYLRLRDFRAAAEVLETHVDLHPTDSEALYKLAATYAGLRMWSDAVEQYRAAFSDYSDDARFLSSFARALWNIGDLEASEDYLRRAIATGRSLRVDRAGLVEVLAATHKIDEAIEAARNYVNEDPSAPDGWQMLGNMHFIARHYRESREAFEELLRIDPEWMDSHASDRSTWEAVRDAQ